VSPHRRPGPERRCPTPHAVTAKPLIVKLAEHPGPGGGRRGRRASGADAAEFLAVGAAVVAVGTEGFRDPRAGSRISAELELSGSRRATSAPALDLD
jgi:hypothetical protein